MTPKHAIAQLTTLFLTATALCAQTTAPKAPAGLDIAAIDSAVGKSGQVMAGDVYRISFPRSDLNVTVGSVKIRPGFALGGWAAFKAAAGQTVAHGDLVLLESEINPVISALQQHNFEITALHNHITGASTPTMYLHFWGQGTPVALGQALKDALGRTKTPMTAPAAAPASAPDFPADEFQKAIGLKGTVANGVLSLSQPRPEAIQMHGVMLPPSMGMATAINVQSAGSGKVAATGDFVMLADEVNKVARALRQHDIGITALHNHLVHGSPDLYFMHFWGEGDAATVAAGLKAGLDLLKK
jgi:uncharacterized protein DUF1259